MHLLDGVSTCQENLSANISNQQLDANNVTALVMASPSGNVQIASLWK